MDAEPIEAPGGFRIEPTPEGYRITHSSDPGRVVDTACTLDHARRITSHLFAQNGLELPARRIER